MRNVPEAGNSASNARDSSSWQMRATTIPRAGPTSTHLGTGWEAPRPWLVVWALALGHFTVDLYSGAVGALQPFLVERLGLSLTQVGLIGGLFAFASSVCQPLFGLVADRLRTPVFVVLAPFVAGVLISSLPLAPGFEVVLILAAIGGSAVAAFHPQASASVAASGYLGHGSRMALFLSSGTLGLSVGPTYVSLASKIVPLEQFYQVALPGALVTALLMVVRSGARMAVPERVSWEPLRASARPIALLSLLVVLRSVLQTSMGQFLPLYLHLERGLSISEANYALTLFMGAGAIGGFTGGWLADRIGPRRVIRVSMATTVPLFLSFLMTKGLLSFVCLALSGFFLLLTIPVMVVMAQQRVPTHAATVAALTMGFAWGTAGMVFVPMVGWAADRWTLAKVFPMLGAFPALGLIIESRLTEPKEQNPYGGRT